MTKKIKKTSLFPVETKNVSLPPIKETELSVKRTLLSVLKRGSLTVECAFILPVFFLAVITLISIMGLFGSAVRETVVLRNRAETAAEAMGDAGAGKWVRLYSFVSPGTAGETAGMLGIKALCAAKVRIWNGRGPDDYAAHDKESAGEYVYVAETGEVYHTAAECSHIALEIRKIAGDTVDTARNEYGAHYHGCEKCVAGEDPEAVVYVGAYGDRYHNDEHCSGIKRTVRLVPKAQAEALPLCERCAAEGKAA